MAIGEDRVCLRVEGELFVESRELLSEHSGYFRAMFSGSYREAEQEIISLEVPVIDVRLMQEVLEYMHTGVWRPRGLSEVMRLLSAVSFLQVDGLVSVLEQHLEDNISFDTWLDILEAAETTHLDTLARKATGYSLTNLPAMFTNVPEFPNINRLHWYLSHSHLAADDELQIFRLGAHWIMKQQDIHMDTVFVVIGSLDVNKLTDCDLAQIAQSSVVQRHARALIFVKCLRRIMQEYGVLNTEAVARGEESVAKNFPRKTYEDATVFVESSLRREPVREACITAVSLASRSEGCREPQYIYKWSGSNGAVKPWLKVAEGLLWGWTWAVWETHRVVVVGGEYGRGSGRFERGVRIYDTFTCRWRHHNVVLPPRRHAGTAVHNNQLYLIGGAGSFRMILSSCVSYDLITQTCTSLADMPERIQSPAITIHGDDLYVAGQENLYKLTPDRTWQTVTRLPSRADSLLSWSGHVCVADSTSEKLLIVDCDGNCIKEITFKNYVAGICNSGGKLVAFTRSLMDDECYVELEHDVGDEYKSRASSTLRYHPTSGCASVYIGLPPLRTAGHSPFAAQYLRHISAEDSKNSNELG